MTRVLVIGSGGREHALVWKLRQSRGVREVLCAPGNGGIAAEARCFPVPAADQAGVLALVRSEKVDCVVVGPEAPLAEGLVDFLLAQGVAAVGPQRLAARLESSKVFAKEFMLRHGIPAARSAVVRTTAAAFAHIGSRETAFPLVVKADGLAAGKGVIIAQDAAEARDAVTRIMVDREFGASGDQVLLEEFLTGREASYIVFTDGEAVVPAVTAQDHKKAFDNDAGPNTGGMGAYSIDRMLASELEKEILERVIRPAVDGMRAEGTPFRGMLYAGLMLTAAGPKALEFNVRMGDPEGQVILPRLESDFVELCEALCAGRLREYQARWSPKAAVCVVLASGGYPGPYGKGKPISGLDLALEDPRIAVFHAGTRRAGDSILTDGGRVLGVTALAGDLAEAVTASYGAARRIHFEGMHYRRDIGARVLGPGR
jgi:phosphoribosylamine---glycine ligase